MYENRLKIEFDLLQKLQASEVKDIVDIFYQERDRDTSHWKSIKTRPNSALYPNKFKVTYHFPKMYVGPDKIKKNWSGTIIFEVPEHILMHMGSGMGVKIENDSFEEGEVPYNNHINKTYICTGTAWTIAQQGYGIWYFIICVGCLLNLERFMIDEKREHLNGDALTFWRTKRNMQPTNKIKWPFDLNMRDKNKHSNSTTPSIRFGQRQEAPKPTIVFGAKKAAPPLPHIVFGKRN